LFIPLIEFNVVHSFVFFDPFRSISFNSVSIPSSAPFHLLSLKFGLPTPNLCFFYIDVFVVIITVLFFKFPPPLVQALLDNNCFGNNGLQSYENKKANSRGLLHRMTKKHMPPSKATVKIGIDVEDVSPSPPLVINLKNCASKQKSRGNSHGWNGEQVQDVYPKTRSNKTN
jgi:hypothetical protein